MNNHTAPPTLLIWSITPWLMNGEGGWKQQPIILIEGQIPFFADHPKAYITKLREMRKDKTLTRGPFWTFIGQLKDGLELSWNIRTIPLPQVKIGE